MKENIETKDVQRTEYLDKNGLDMLWAKIKENTHNQVEVERNRATTQENRIIDTKADKSELHSSYVSNSTFTALQEKVAANTDAISDKQDAGNYLHYKTLNNEGYYEIPAIRIPNSGGNNKTDIDSQSISVNCSYPDSHTTITCDGISNTDNNANHVYATDGSIADLTQYIKKGDTDVKFVPYVKKGSNSYNSGEAYYLSSSLQLGDSQEYHTVITHAAFDARYGNHRTNLNVDSTADYAVDISNLGTSRSVKVVWDTMKLAFTPDDNNVDSGTTYSLAGVRLPAYLSSKKPENTLVLGTDEDYKEIGVDISPLENGKVPTKYLTSATKESLGVVKVGDGLNVTDGTISVDTTAIAALEAKVTDNTAAITNINVSKGIPYDASVTDKYQTDKDFSVKNSNGATADFGPNNGIRLSNENFAFGVNTTDCIKFSVQNGTTYSKITPFGLESKVNDETYINCSSDSFLEIKNRENRISLQPAQLLVENGHITILMNQEKILIKNIVDNTQAMLTPYQLLMKVDDSQVILNSNGVSLPNGDNNHVLTSNASTIDITQYVLKSVYDEKIAALEARIAALEAKHAETA